MAGWGFAATLGLVAVGICTAPTEASAQAGGGIAFVNTETILRQTPGYDTADSTLAAERAVFQQEATALQGQLDSAMAAFDQQQLVLSPQAREEKVNELRALNERVQSRMQELQNQDLERQRELVAPFTCVRIVFGQLPGAIAEARRFIAELHAADAGQVGSRAADLNQ